MITCPYVYDVSCALISLKEDAGNDQKVEVGKVPAVFAEKEPEDRQA